MSILAFSRYGIMLCTLSMYDPLIWFATRQALTFADRFFTLIFSAIRLVRINPTLNPSKHEDPSVNKVHGYGISSSTDMSMTGKSSSGFYAIKYAKI
ncbi:hypothetical protein Tco_0943298 [Tanacetum coccineum]